MTGAGGGFGERDVTQVGQPPPQLLVDGLRADEVGRGCRQVRGVQDERAGLVPTEATVRPDQLLERRDLAGLLVPDRVDHQVRAVRVGVGPRHLQPGRVAEGRQRIASDHCPAGKLELSAGTEHQWAAGLGCDEQEADSGVLDQRADQVGVPLVDSSRVRRRVSWVR